MITILDYLTLAVLGFSLAAPLGPVNAQMIKNVISKGGRQGWLRGVLTGVGALNGDFLVAMSVLYIGAEYLTEFLSIKWLKVVLYLLNVAILSFIGISALRTDPTVDAELDKQRSTIQQYFLGMLIVITSPWSYLWWSLFGPYILALGIPLATLMDRFIVTLCFISGIFFWVLLFNTALALSHRFATPKVLRWITRSTALILFYFAIKILIDTVVLLLS